MDRQYQCGPPPRTTHYRHMPRDRFTVHDGNWLEIITWFVVDLGMLCMDNILAIVNNVAGTEIYIDPW